MKKLFFILLLSVSILNVNAQETAKEFKKLGIEKYKAKTYPESVEAFDKAVELNNAEGTVDTTLFYYGALSSNKAKNYEKLVFYTNKAIELGYTKGGKVYLLSATAHKKLGNDSIQEAVLRAGLVKHPATKNTPKLKKKLAKKLLIGGNVFYENGKTLHETANKNISNQEKYDKLIAERNVQIELAKPYFEESYNLNSEDEATKKGLIVIYDYLETPEADRLVKS